MRRIVARTLLVLCALSFCLVVPTRDADAWRRSYRHRAYHHPHPKPPSTVVWVVPPAPGKSSWCKEHPKRCHTRAKHDPKVNTRHEYCIDKHGNGDGYVSAWEGKRFGNQCKAD